MNDLFQQHFQEKGFKQPTLIQERVAEPLRAGETVLGLSPTGSGKNLSVCFAITGKSDSRQRSAIASIGTFPRIGDPNLRTFFASGQV
jgi:Superfamily II DNA and RNA helicases